MYKALMDYLQGCPQLAGQTFNFDFIGDRPVEWSLHVPTTSPEVGKTVTGDTKNKLDFLLVAVVNWGDDALTNVGNLDGFQEIKKWLGTNNRSHIYPAFSADKEVKKVTALTDGYIEATDGNTARYQIQCRVEYIQKPVSENILPLYC